MKEIPKIPLGLQMALAHNPSAMQAFLKLDDSAQDSIIDKASSIKTKRELQLLVNDIPQIRLN
ncbi:MAG: hypothetical protein IJX02_05860 [Clostridia bacterium]|nr:hypothetical protein [Clostridia bacterium]